MAKRQSTLQRGVQSEVTCPLCLDIFTEPKRLPCDHVYCKQCLRGLGLRSVTGKSISCPECRRDTPIPNNDVANFPTPHQVNRLIEMHLKSAKTATQQPAAATCKVHKSQSLDLYCETCESLVCGHCIAKTCGKKKHDYGFIDESVKKYQMDLRNELEPVKKLHLQMSSALDTISAMEVELQSKREEKLKQIESTFDTLAVILEGERKNLKESVEKTFQENLMIHSTTKNEISKTQEELKSLIHYIEVASKLDFLADIDRTRQRIKDLDTSSRSLQLQPTPSPEIEVELLDPAELEDLCKTRNFMYQDILKSHSDRSMYLTGMLVEQTNKTSPNLQPQNEQRNILGNVDAIVHVTRKPEYLNTTQLQGVTGIKCHQGKLFASKLNQEIIILDAMFTKRVIPIYGVSEIAVDDIHIYVTDMSKNRIMKLYLNGIVVQSMGTKGDGPGEFDYPNGIQLSKDDKLYVCDSGNDRVQVFDKELKFERLIGRKGRENSCFDCPDDLAFDDAGNLYIVEQGNHRIQVLTPQGQHICNIGRHGSGQGEINNPGSAAIHKDMIYITDSRNKRISVFKLTGEFVTTFGEGILTRPECIAIDDNGYIHVTDVRSRIVTFIQR